MRVKLLLFSAVLAVVSSFAFAEDFSVPRMLRVSLLEGDVTYQRPDLERWVDLSINTPILEGDRIWVGREGRAELELENGNFARFSVNTIVEVSGLNSAAAEIRLSQGVATFDLKSVTGSFSVFAPLFSVRLKEAARFRLDVDEDGSGRVVMFEGRAEVSSQTANLYVQNGETVRFSSQDADRYYLGTNYVQDDWDRWNEERSAYLAKAAEDGLHYGDQGWTTADLYNYGTWYTDSSYGRIWRPSVASDWVPFRDGRWVWYGSLGWNWVSYEPWGWVPYHYGRWAYLNHYGWSWVPGRRYGPWCPGAVSWVQGPSWVGWVPLAPFEPWYPYPYSSVNIFVSKNFGHRFGFTYWHRDHFINGTHVPGFRPPRDPYRDGTLIAGQPRLAPTPASRMPVVGSSSRTFRNEDLEARRSMRERLIGAQNVSTPNLSTPSSAFDRSRELRNRISSRDTSSFVSNPQSRTPGLSSGASGSEGPASANRSRIYENLDRGRSVSRSEQRQRAYRIDGSGSDSRAWQRSSPSRWAPPTSRIDSPGYSPGSPNLGTGVGIDSRGSIRESFRGRSDLGVRDRYAPQSIQRGSSTRFAPSMPSSPSPSMTIPQRSAPFYTSPGTRSVGPSQGYQGPTVGRGSIYQSHSGGRSAGSGNNEGRGAVRGRMGR
jgi:hypothetical protein